MEIGVQTLLPPQWEACAGGGIFQTRFTMVYTHSSLLKNCRSALTEKYGLLFAKTTVFLWQPRTSLRCSQNEFFWHLSAACRQPFNSQAPTIWRGCAMWRLGRLVAGSIGLGLKFGAVCPSVDCDPVHCQMQMMTLKCLCFHVCIHLRVCWIWISVAVIPNGALSENVAIVLPSPVSRSQRCRHNCGIPYMTRTMTNIILNCLEKGWLRVLCRVIIAVAGPLQLHFCLLPAKSNKYLTNMQILLSAQIRCNINLSDQPRAPRLEASGGPTSTSAWWCQEMFLATWDTSSAKADSTRDSGTPVAPLMLKSHRAARPPRSCRVTAAWPRPHRVTTVSKLCHNRVIQSLAAYRIYTAGFTGLPSASLNCYTQSESAVKTFSGKPSFKGNDTCSVNHSPWFAVSTYFNSISTMSLA